MRGYTQKQVAHILGTDQAKVSQVVRGKLTGISVERMIKYLLALGVNMDVHLSEPSQLQMSRPMRAGSLSTLLLQHVDDPLARLRGSSS